MPHNPAEGVRWDLSDLYEGPDDPRIAQDLKLAQSKAVSFEKKHKRALERFVEKKTARFDPVPLLRDYKALLELVAKIGVFAHLHFAEKTGAPERGAFLQKIRTALTDVQAHTLFWEVLWNRVDPKRAKAVMAHPKAAPDRHYLEHLRHYAPHTLSEPEEKVLSAKSNTSSNAFSRLFDETLSSIPFYLQAEGQREKKTEPELLALLYSPLRDLRRKAAEGLAEGLKPHARVLTYVFNMILADHRLSMKLRNFTHPAQSRNLANETDLETLENLIASVKKGYAMGPRFYDLKRRLLGYTEMRDYDRYAPVIAEEEAIPWKRCREIVLGGYYAFSEEAGKIAEQFFEKRWIDAEIREGKHGGGFCAETTPVLHPYILVNYTGSLRDVLTVAHELGHGVHQHLARRAGILESSAPLTLAETASVFGEMLVFEKLLEAEKDRKRRLALLCGKIDDNFATVFRQIVLTDFELEAHRAGLAEGELTTEALGNLWMKANAAFYGSSVKLTETYRSGWQLIPHFIHTPFYCYAYAFAQLFVLALFRRYKTEGAAFVPTYLEMLSLGGSRKPEDIAGMAGLDLGDPLFWRSGLKILDELVKDAEALAQEELDARQAQSDPLAAPRVRPARERAARPSPRPAETS